MADMVGKWGADVAGRGFAQVPNYLLLLNQFLDEERRLSPAELLILIELTGAWWARDEMPFPALKTLAVRCGISDRQAQRAVSRLEEIHLIKRVKRKQGGMIASNAYDMVPLVRFLGEVAKAFPNEFERKIKRDEAQKLGSLLDSGAHAQASVAEADEPVKRARLAQHKPKRVINLDD